MKIACFITSHGFGHATRSTAVLKKLAQKEKLELIIFSSLPAWFFQENLQKISHKYYPTETDIGLIQKSPFLHDLPLTINRLKDFLEFKEDKIKPIFEILHKELLDFIFCDISPLGIYLGKKFNIPTCLLENFTWDWIYESYALSNQSLKEPIEKLNQIFSQADLHIQTNPICRPLENLHQVNPIFRPFLEKREKTAIKLGINDKKPILLITTGGITQKFSFLERIKNDGKHFYLITGDYPKLEKGKNFILIPKQNDFYFPDLVQLSDGVIGKVGYGTLAEAWGAQKPLIGTFRENFRESGPMRNFFKNNIPGFEISNLSFQQGEWIPKIEKLLNCAKNSSKPVNGSEQATQIISNWIKSLSANRIN